MKRLILEINFSSYDTLSENELTAAKMRIILKELYEGILKEIKKCSSTLLITHKKSSLMLITNLYLKKKLTIQIIHGVCDLLFFRCTYRMI